jgi:hypothetical protein
LAFAIETIPTTSLSMVINEAPNGFTPFRDVARFSPNFEVEFYNREFIRSIISLN